MEIKAVVFDIDGTLYPYEIMYLKSLPIFMSHPKFILNFGKVRKSIRKDGNNSIDSKDTSLSELFRKKEAELLSVRLKVTKEKALQYIDRIIYNEWINLFHGIKPYSGVKKVLEYLKSKKVKLGVLSDFPAETKLKFLGIKEYFNAVFCSEESGKLKPDPNPFYLVCDRLNVETDKTLYVGDNPGYDIIGAKNAGLKTALFLGVLARLGRSERKRGKYTADFIFKNYNDFLQILLKIFDN